jgi:hypothetical protein
VQTQAEHGHVVLRVRQEEPLEDLVAEVVQRQVGVRAEHLEEFRRAGVEVAFLHHPISEDPSDQLLLQIQGAIAEYERAVLAERFRRGKLQKARDGHLLSAKAPYGYRYVPRRDAVPGHLVVDDAEAEMVCGLFVWVADEQRAVRAPKRAAAE